MTTVVGRDARSRDSKPCKPNFLVRIVVRLFRRR